MDENKENIEETPPTNLNYYWTIIFICFFLINLFKNYFNSVKIVKPILLGLTLIIVLIYEVNDECNLETIPLIQITTRSLLLLSVYLYCESTVRCIPIINLTISTLFNYPLLGDILKGSLAYLLTFSFNYILNIYNKENSEESNIVCNVKNSSNNLIITIGVLGIIAANSYLEYI